MKEGLDVVSEVVSYVDCLLGCAMAVSASGNGES